MNPINFKIAFRHILKNKVQSAINIVGLALGISCCLLLFIFVHHELSFDRFHKGAQNIYKVYPIRLDGPEKQPGPTTQPPLGPALVEAFEEIDAFLRVRHSRFIATLNGKQKRENCIYTDHNFFSFFSFQLNEGDKESALREPASIVITPHKAIEYFGTEHCLGRILTLLKDGREADYAVTGIIEEPPKNSTLQFDFVLPFNATNMGRDESYYTDWGIYDIETFIRLNPSAEPSILQIKIADIVKKNVPESKWELAILPLTKLHTSPDIAWGATINPVNYYILAGIAVLILLLAFINFANFSVGMAAKRAKEMGVRHVVGAGRMHILRQSLAESIITCFIALILGLLLADLFLPVFNRLIERELVIWQTAHLSFLMFCLGVVLFAGIVSGLYPATVLSGFKPINIFQGNWQISGNSTFSRALLIFQFCATTFLLGVTIIMAQQINFMRTKDLGITKEPLLSVSIPSRDYQVYKNELLAHHNIVDMTCGSRVFSTGFSTIGDLPLRNKTHDVCTVNIDFNYFTFLDVPFIKGQSFQQANKNDQANMIVVNEAFVKAFELESPLEQKVLRWDIIGVVQDFHFSPLHSAIPPTIFNFGPGGSVLIKIKPKDMQQTLRFIADTNKKLWPDRDIECSFLDEQVEEWYKTEKRWNHITSISSVFAIFIANFGLLGLLLMAAANRRKEIGIRKVLGSSILGIAALLLKNIIALIAIAGILAIPIAWYTMDKWLNNFAYRIDLTIWPFLSAIVAALAIALLTVSWQMTKAATANPVEALRHE